MIESLMVYWFEYTALLLMFSNTLATLTIRR